MIATIAGIVGLATRSGWFTQQEWCEEIAGPWESWDAPTGGMLAQLEEETGRTYPELRRSRKDVFDAYSKFKHAMPWNKASRAKAYQDTLRTFAQAIEAQAQAQGGISVGLSGLIQSPIVIAIGVVVLILVVVLVAIAGRR